MKEGDIMRVAYRRSNTARRWDGRAVIVGRISDATHAFREPCDFPMVIVEIAFCEMVWADELVPNYATPCPGHQRHWFSRRHAVGDVQPVCVRCGSPNPRLPREALRSVEAQG